VDSKGRVGKRVDSNEDWGEGRVTQSVVLPPEEELLQAGDIHTHAGDRKGAEHSLDGAAASEVVEAAAA